MGGIFRLWIHAAAEHPPEPVISLAEEGHLQDLLLHAANPSEDVAASAARKEMLPPVPSRYPTRCVVGCVMITDCIPFYVRLGFQHCLLCWSFKGSL